MHEAGVVHRDMNPTNVFIHDILDSNGQRMEMPIVKIIDFNVSKLHNPEEKPQTEKSQ